MAPATSTTVRVPVPLRERLEQLADENERSFAAEVRIALREHVERQDVAGAATAGRVAVLAR